MMKCFFVDFISFHPGSLAAKSLALNKIAVPYFACGFLLSRFFDGRA